MPEARSALSRAHLCHVGLERASASLRPLRCFRRWKAVDRSVGAGFRVPVHLSLAVVLTYMPGTMSQTPTSLAQVGAWSLFNGTTNVFFLVSYVSDLPPGSTCHPNRQPTSAHHTGSLPCSGSHLGGRDSSPNTYLTNMSLVIRQAEGESIDAARSGNVACSHPVQVVLQGPPEGISKSRIADRGGIEARGGSLC